MGYLLLGITVLGLVTIYLILRYLGDHSEGVPGDAAAIAAQALAESDAFRGSSEPDNVPWDGGNRLAPPTQDGSFV